MEFSSVNASRGTGRDVSPKSPSLISTEAPTEKKLAVTKNRKLQKITIGGMYLASWGIAGWLNADARRCSMRRNSSAALPPPLAAFFNRAERIIWSRLRMCVGTRKAKLATPDKSAPSAARPMYLATFTLSTTAGVTENTSRMQLGVFPASVIVSSNCSWKLSLLIEFRRELMANSTATVIISLNSALDVDTSSKPSRAGELQVSVHARPASMSPRLKSKSRTSNLPSPSVKGAKMHASPFKGSKMPYNWMRINRSTRTLVIVVTEMSNSENLKSKRKSLRTTVFKPVPSAGAIPGRVSNNPSTRICRLNPISISVLPNPVLNLVSEV
mmetsp:Transcript_5098/g.11723  ORF Transcript_5098/g.11723 Transcript_5098/m.11723 type:complete len:328 (-) Transcript_5098:169-1152(-)